MVAYCSSCREDRGRHTLRGSHSSYDSRRRYLSDAYLEKSPIFEERSTRGIIPGGAMVTGGVCSMYLQNYIRVISFVQKWRDHQRHSERGSNPKKSSSKGSSPKRRMALCH
jgi:hypothetical protein